MKPTDIYINVSFNSSLAIVGIDKRGSLHHGNNSREGEDDRCELHGELLLDCVRGLERAWEKVRSRLLKVYECKDVGGEAG